jgi:2-dehydropantoate 2-reductase
MEETTNTKVCVVGAGAIGGFLAATLALAGHDVTAVARGSHLEAIRRHGLTLVRPDGGKSIASRLRAVERLTDAGKQDVVLLTVKAHHLEPIARNLPALLGPKTTIVTLQNGIPWWYFQKHGGPLEGRNVKAVDPDGILAASIPVERLIGSVVYVAASVIAPGVVYHPYGNRILLGELDGAATHRVQTLSRLLTQTGLVAPVTPNIRAEIWLKLWGNVAFNPISALTHGTLADIARHPATRALTTSVMTEAQVIARKLGIEFPVSLEQRIAGAESVGSHKTSMLQDIEAGRPIELEALVGAVIELGRLTQTPTPHIGTLYACAGLLAKTLAHGNGRLKIEPSNHFNSAQE